MEFTTIKTEDKKLDKIIKETSMLPYFMNYFDEDEELQNYAIKGKISVYTFKQKEK